MAACTWQSRADGQRGISRRGGGGQRAAALLLQADPSLTPDDVKCRLMATAQPAIDVDGSLAYSIFQQGTGLINAYEAVYSTASSCANRGLNIDHDLLGIEHYAGFAHQALDDPAREHCALFFRDFNGLAQQLLDVGWYVELLSVVERPLWSSAPTAVVPTHPPARKRIPPPAPARALHSMKLR